MKRFWRTLFLSVSLLEVGAGQTSDDFNDGNDDGWTRLLPLAVVGGTANFTFPDGDRYRVQVGASPDPATYGRARGGSLRDGISHQSFRVSVDIVEPDTSLKQDFGILARVTTPGLGTLNGYSATFDATADRVYLSRVDDEDGTTLSTTSLTLEQEKSYRLIFHGFEDQFLMEVFETGDLSAPILSMTGSDATYAAGSTGIFGFAAQATGTVDVTFDNFSAGENPDVDQDGMSDPEEVSFFGDLSHTGGADFDHDGVSNAQEILDGTNPTIAGLPVTGFSAGPDFLTISFQMITGKTFTLETSADLESWSVDPTAIMTDHGNGTAQLQSERTVAKEFLRIRMSD
jgi:hypothetical protein